jgi:hypothetical protein
MSPFLNWALCLTRVERLAPHSRVCACLDSTGLARWSLRVYGNQLAHLEFVIYGIAKCPRMWQALLMAKSKLTAREKFRRERERANSLEDRSRQLMRKARQLQQKSEHEDIRQAAAGIAKEIVEGK